MSNSLKPYPYSGSLRRGGGGFPSSGQAPPWQRQVSESGPWEEKGLQCAELESCRRVREEGPGEFKMKRSERKTRRGRQGRKVRVPIPRGIRSSHHSGHQGSRRRGDLRDRCPWSPEPGDGSTESRGAGASAVASIPASDRWPAPLRTPHRAREAR